MMKTRAAITATGVYIPPDKLTNADLEKMVDTTDQWIVERCGVKERRILKDKDKATAFMGAEAARQALSKRGMPASEIELVIVSTATPEYQFPATSNIVADMIGANRAWGFDLMAACSGFLYALNTARQFIESGAHKKILVIGSDKMSTVADYTNRTTCILFGDAAGAVLLEADESGNGIIDARLYSDGSGRKYLLQEAGGSLSPASAETVSKRQHFISMDGKNVFKVAVVKMAEVAEEMMKRNALSAEQVAYLVPHQANKRIVEATAERMGIGMDKVMMNIERYGNTTCASIPLCLNEWEAKLRTGDNLVLCSFGAGFTWGGIFLKWAYNGN
ncbi:MAG: beta-ketoacyl-ACP synthase III [Bacteroidota bacterium]